MSECEKFQELISAALDDELNEDEKAQLAEHLKSCPECARVYEAFSSLSEAMDSELQEMPSELHENIMAELRREDIKKKNKKLSKPLKTILASAACLALVLAAAVFTAPQKENSPVLYSMAAIEEEGSETFSADSAYEDEFNKEASSENSLQQSSVPELREMPPVAAPAGSAAEDEGVSQASVSMFSAEPQLQNSYPLSQENWDSFLSLLSGTPMENPENLPDFVFSVCLEDSPEANYIELYSSGQELCYYDSSDGNYYSAKCGLEKATIFLKIS